MKLKIDPRYMDFYVDGRGVSIDTRKALEIDDLVKQVSAGPDDPHEVLLRLVEKIAQPLEIGSEKRTWLAVNEAKIGDRDKHTAYAHYLKGQVDETVWELEDEIFDHMAAPDEDEDDDEEDEDDEGEDEEDDDDDDEDEPEGKDS